MNKAKNPRSNTLLPKRPRGGRPKWIPTPKILAEIEQLASRGLTYAQIAHCCGVSELTLRERRLEFPELEERIQVGKARGVRDVANALFESAIGRKDANGKFITLPNTRAQVEFLKRRDRENWGDKAEVAVTGKDVHPVDSTREVLDATDTNTLRALLAAVEERMADAGIPDAASGGRMRDPGSRN